MYKFFGEPLKIITSKTSGKPLFRFDTKGEFITDDPEIIRRAMGFFDNMPMKAEATGERVKKTHIVPPLTITTKDDKPIETPVEKPAVITEMSDEEIRAKAKEKGIKNWHNKKIENLLIELKEE
jgi:hypothetical protein